MSKLVTIRTFYQLIEAQLAKARLEDVGIPAFLRDEHTISINPLYTHTLGGIKLQVHEADEVLALQVLEC
jgi:hypothetical protein